MTQSHFYLLNQIFYSGESFGLSLILNAEQDKYYYDTYLKDSAGFSIQLLDQDETSDLHVRGFQVGPGTSADVAITAKQVIVLYTLRLLSSPLSLHGHSIVSHTTFGTNQ